MKHIPTACWAVAENKMSEALGWRQVERDLMSVCGDEEKLERWARIVESCGARMLIWVC